MTALEGFISFVVIALVGWAIAEVKYRTISFHHSSQEDAVNEKAAATLKKDGYKENSIRDILKTITFKGYKAI